MRRLASHGLSRDYTCAGAGSAASFRQKRPSETAADGARGTARDRAEVEAQAARALQRWRWRAGLRDAGIDLRTRDDHVRRHTKRDDTDAEGDVGDDQLRTCRVDLALVAVR